MSFVIACDCKNGAKAQRYAKKNLGKRKKDMINDNNIYFDEKSGISVEEQKEILEQINRISEKNRASLSDAATELYDKERIPSGARKKSLFFPVVVNIAAVLILGIGALVLFLFNARKDIQIRTGSGGYSLTEQALIGELTASQQEALLTLQQLSSEQERAAGIDAYLSGSISIISELILADRFDEAAVSISELKVFLNTPSFDTNRTFMARKEFYIQSINSLEKLVADIQRSGYSVVQALETQIAELEGNIEELSGNLETVTERSAEQSRRIVQLEDTVSEKERNISSLETERTNLNNTVTELRNTNSQQETTINQLNDQLTNIRQALQALSQ